MQIYALNEKGEKVSLNLAQRNQRYVCLECQKPLRVRGGKFRRLHFYHKESSPLCRQSGKSFTHLQIQIALKNKIAPQESMIEHFFPEIKRIADVYWPQKKIVFEIQCSSIRPEEIQARVKDYAKLKLKVVWILHDRLYNKGKLTPQEKSLYFLPHYYTDMNARGKGKIYDQYFFLKGGRIQKKSPRFPIEIEKPLFFEKLDDRFPKERQKWSLFFFGDLYHQKMTNLFFKRKRKSWFLSFFQALYFGFLERNTD